MAADKSIQSTHNYVPMTHDINFIDNLSDQDLKRVNEILPWKSFLLDCNGRTFGAAASERKRNEPAKLPDKRILEFSEVESLSGKTVVELGCFEGIHSVSLAMQGAIVYALDSRIENIIKTLVRSKLLGVEVNPILLNLEDFDAYSILDDYDYCCHIGVLYHLTDPIRHLKILAKKIRSSMLLDTHYIQPSMVNDEYIVDGVKFSCRVAREFGREEVFSGMQPFSRWMTMKGLITALESLGFKCLKVLSDRLERNGPRVTLIASRL
jgi:2-polyprenyl-3-methyl-5-hydroxy-6-metoxy-1,4-benzoquinol methylase